MTEDDQMTSDEQPAAGRPSPWRRAAGVALRLLVVVLVGIGLGAGAFWGVPAAYRDFIEPVRQNTERLDQSQAALASLRESQSAANATQSAALADIQGQVARQAESLSAVQADVGSLKASQPTAVAALQTLDKVEADLADLQAAATLTAGRIDGLDSAAATPNPTIEALGQRMEILRLMQLVSQARLSISEDNLGQATTDLEAAIAALSDLTSAAEDGGTAALEDVARRLDLAQQELKTNPTVAADDLDIAWELLVELSRAQ
jgi:chromosome segregation ATPase